MTELNNNLNIGSNHRAYAPGFKKADDKTPPTVEEKGEAKKESASLDNDPKAVGGKSQIKKASSVNFKADMDAFMKNPQLAQRTINAGDFAYEMMNADGVAHAYEKSCCGSLDAAYDCCGPSKK